LQGGATFGPGQVGQAFSLNGTDAYVRVPDSASLYPQAGSFTVEAWINTTVTTGFQTIITHYECANSCPSGMAASVYVLGVTNGKFDGDIRGSAGLDQDLTGTTMAADGKFHHVGMQRDIVANQMRLYVDGALEVGATLTANGTLANTDGEAD